MRKYTSGVTIIRREAEAGEEEPFADAGEPTAEAAWAAVVVGPGEGAEVVVDADIVGSIGVIRGVAGGAVVADLAA